MQKILLSLSPEQYKGLTALMSADLAKSKSEYVARLIGSELNRRNGSTSI